MSNLKDSEIDDLFQRASDKYPLRTDSASWDRMAAALDKEPPAPPSAVDAEEKRKKRRFFWLFLLLPLAGVGYYTWHHAGTQGSAGTPAVAVINSTSNNSTATDKEAQPDDSLSQTAVNSRQQPGGERKISGGDVGTAIGGRASDGRGGSGGIGERSRAGGSVRAHGSSRPGGNDNAKEGNRSIGGGSSGEGEGSGGGSNSDGESNAVGKNNTGGKVDFSAKSGLGEDRLFYDLQRAPIPRDYRLAVNVKAPAAAKDTTAKAKASGSPKTKHFYAGVFGSPDISTVKMQSVKGVGTTFGVILGYTFNGGHWAIETGANIDRKKYYTDGEYFNTKEVRLPPTSWLTSVNGICYMWEIPLNVRYNFNPGAKTSWFATAGLSTYLMSQEKYAYGLQWSGSSGVYDSSWDFHKPSQYPFSIINLSAGFEQRLGKIGKLRVEPYVRLPLTGLGTGKLPILSAGVNIGITKQLW